MLSNDFLSLEAVPHPLLVLDRTKQTLYRNQEFLETFGPNANLTSIVIPSERHTFLQHLDERLTAHERFQLPIRCITANDDEVTATFTAKPNDNNTETKTKDGTEPTPMWTASILFIEPQHTNNLTSEYLDHLSHEIRTPLHGILGMIDSLDGSTLDREQRECLKYLKFSADALYQIVNYFLDISKFQSGMLELSSKPFSLYALVDNLVHAYRYAVEGEDVRMALEYHVADEMTDFVGDELRIRQIVANLLSNAVKFTENGTIVARVESEKLGSGAHEVKISIVDTGKGIPEPALVKLFGAFTQFDGDARMKFDGTGLGLYLCKKLSTLMGGDVGVASNVGQGSTFWFTVPLEPSREVIETRSGSEATFEFDDEEPLHRRVFRVLIADDNVINQRVLARMLERLGVHHELASDGSQAVKISDEMVFNAVLMDCDMPIMDGFTAAKTIRKSSSCLNPFQSLL